MVIYRYSQKIESKEEMYIKSLFVLSLLLICFSRALAVLKAAFKVLIGGLSRDINMFPQIHTFFRQRDIWDM